MLFLCLNFSVQLLQKHTQLPFKSQFQDYYTKPILFCLGDILGALFTATFYPFFGMKRIGLLSLSVAFFSSIGMLYLQDRNREYMQKHEKSELTIETMQFRHNMVFLAFASEICLSFCWFSLLVSIFCERINPQNNVFPRVKRLSSVGFCYLFSFGFIMLLDSSAKPKLQENGCEIYTISIALALILTGIQ